MLCQSEGPLDAKIVLIGEAPGREEELSGRPFVGGSGQLLSQCLAKAGIDRGRVFVTNIMNIRPPGNDFGAFYEDSKQRRNPSRMLLDGYTKLGCDLERIRPNIIVPLGNEPLRAITNLYSIGKWRGSILTSRYGKCVPSYHPAAVLRDYSLRPILELDLKRVAKQSFFPEVRTPQHVFHLDPSFDLVLDWLRQIREGQTIAFDIETVGDLIRCLGIAISSREALCIPFMSSLNRSKPETQYIIPELISTEPGSEPASIQRASSHWTEEQEHEILKELDRVFSNPKIFKVAQNFPFDASRLEKQFGLVVRGLRLDTLLGFHTCYCLVGDTEIFTVEGKKSIRSLVGSTPWVWSWKNGKPYLSKPLAIFKTADKAKVIRVHYRKKDWKQGWKHLYMDVTPNHKFMLLSGQWIEAKDLKLGSSLTAMMMSVKGENRHSIRFNGKTEYQSRVIYEQFNQPLLEGEDVHHKDNNKENDRPENLEALSRSKHRQTYSHKVVYSKSWKRREIIANKEEVMRLRDQGWSWQKIADKFDTSHHTVIDAIKSINHEVTWIEELQDQQEVFDITMPETHCFVANEVVVHNCELPKGLDFLCSIYTEVPYYSDYNVASDAEVWRYNCYDAAVTFEIIEPIEEDLRKNGVYEFYKNHVEPAMLALTRAENRGIRVNVDRMKEQKELLLKEISYENKKKKWIEVGTLTKAIRDLTGLGSLNPNSPKQLAELFYVKLGLTRQINRKSGAVTADKNARDVLSKRFPEHRTLFSLLDEWSQKETLVTGFLSRECRANSRMYTHFNVAGTVTGRISSSDPLDEVGTNLTNIPKGTFRRIFLPDDSDSLLIKADLKSAEWMVVCWAGEIRRYIERYTKDPEWNIHKFAASKNYNIPEEKVSKDSEEYKLSKNGVYGSGYGMQPPKAALTWKTTVEKASYLLASWHRLTPEIKNVYWRKIQNAITSSRCLVNPLGRRRMFFDRLNFPPQELDQIFRDAYSHFAQSTVADLINRAFALMDHFFDPSECRLLLQVHDEIVASCKKTHVEKYVKLFKGFMEYPLRFTNVPEPLIIQAEITVGENWFDQVSLEEWKGKK